MKRRRFLAKSGMTKVCYTSYMTDPIPRLDPIDSLFAHSWRLYKERLVVALQILFIPAGIFAAATISAAGSHPIPFLAVILGLASFTAYILGFIALIVCMGQKTDFDRSYRAAAGMFWPVLWIMILGGLVTFGAFVMLVVPGIIVSVWIGFSIYICVFESRRGLHALTQSREYMRGIWWAFVGRSFLLSLVVGLPMLIIRGIFTVAFTFILGSAASGAVVGGVVYTVLMVFTMPFEIAYSYTIYENVTRLKPEVVSGGAAPARKFFIASAIVGIVAPIAIAGLLIFLAAKGFFHAPAPSGGDMQNPSPIMQSSSTEPA